MNLFYFISTALCTGVSLNMNVVEMEVDSVLSTPHMHVDLTPSTINQAPHISESFTQRLLSTLRNKVPTPNDPEDNMIAISEGKVDVMEAKAYESWYYKERLNRVNWDEMFSKAVISALSVTKRGWNQTPYYLRVFYTQSTRWGSLTEEMRYFAYLESVEYKHNRLPASVDQLVIYLEANKNNAMIRSGISRKMHDKERFIVTPQNMWILSKFQQAALTNPERRILARFATEMNEWPTVKSAAWIQYEADTKISRDMDKRMDVYSDRDWNPPTRSEKAWILNRPFIDLSYAQKRIAVGQSVWKDLDEEKRMWLMLSKFGVESTLTRADLAEKFRLDPNYAPHTSLFYETYDESPLINLWISILPPESRTAQQSEILAAFPHPYFDAWPRMQPTKFKDLNEFGKARKVDARLSYPGISRPLDQEKVDWLNTRTEKLDSSYMKKWRERPIWSKFSEEVKFQEFKKFFRLKDPALTLEVFRARVLNDLPALRLEVLPQMESADRFDGESAQQLFWILSVPKSERTKYEQGFVNNYGYGVFDDFGTNWPYLYAWNDRSISDKFSRGYAGTRYPERQIWYNEFMTTLKDVFGPVEAKNIEAARLDLQTWLISYYYRQSGSLSAKQKNWGWTYFATLKSPEGKVAFQELTLQIAMDRHGRSNFRIRPVKL